MKTGKKLEHMSWQQAERAFADDPVIVVPLGAAAKEHGPHLPLNNDALIAAWLAGEIMKRLPVMVAPPINASYYPAFTEYPGSISLRVATARDLIVDSCRSLASFGLSKFFIVNTGLSTLRPLAAAREQLGADIRFEYLDAARRLARTRLWQPRRRARNFADAAHRTRSRRHVARRRRRRRGRGEVVAYPRSWHLVAVRGIRAGHAGERRQGPDHRRRDPRALPCPGSRDDRRALIGYDRHALS
jgi:hypothetical protein